MTCIVSWYVILRCYTISYHIHLKTPLKGRDPPKETLNKLVSLFLNVVIFPCTGYRLDLPHTQDVTVTTRMTPFDCLRLGEFPRKNRLIWPRLNPSILNTYPSNPQINPTQALHDLLSDFIRPWSGGTVEFMWSSRFSSTTRRGEPRRVENGMGGEKRSSENFWGTNFFHGKNGWQIPALIRENICFASFSKQPTKQDPRKKNSKSFWTLLGTGRRSP